MEDDNGLNNSDNILKLEDNLVLCPNCNGTGYISVEAPLFDDDGNYDLNTDICLVCNGLGTLSPEELKKWGME